MTEPEWWAQLNKHLETPLSVTRSDVNWDTLEQEIRRHCVARAESFLKLAREMVHIPKRTWVDRLLGRPAQKDWTQDRLERVERMMAQIRLAGALPGGVVLTAWYGVEIVAQYWGFRSQHVDLYRSALRKFIAPFVTAPCNCPHTRRDY